MFISKVWGFDNPCGPLVFNAPGWRDNAAKRLQPGDRVILVGTKGDETPEPDRNRVLGMMEPSTKQVATSDFPIPNPSDRRMFRDDGTYRWPYGLLNYCAWEFEPGLFLGAVAPRPGNPFGSAAAAGIVPLTPDEETRVLAHPYHEIPLLKSVNADQKLYGGDGTKRRGAPVPAEGARRGIMHMRNEPAFVYWFRLEFDGAPVGHKIGWAFEWKRRLNQFNSVSLSALGGVLYKAHRTQKFNTARQAFGLEQRMLRGFDDRRHPHNREILTGVALSKLEQAWDEHITTAMLGHPALALAGARQSR